MNTVYIDAVALWSSQLGDWASAVPALRGEAVPEPAVPARPTPALLPANERRRAPDTVAVSMEVAARACADAGLAPGTVASVFASTHGDLAITDYMCATLAQAPDTLSPTKFHNSVHNAAAGYWSIATGCMAPYTAVSAWRHTFAAGLVETLAQVHAEHRPVLLAAYDVESRGPLATVVPSDGMLACALIVVPAPSERSIARLDWRVSQGEGAIKPEARSAAGRALRGNAMADCVALLELLASGRGGGLRYGLGPALVLELELAVDVLTAAPQGAVTTAST